MEHSPEVQSDVGDSNPQEAEESEDAEDEPETSGDEVPQRSSAVVTEKARRATGKEEVAVAEKARRRRSRPRSRSRGMWKERWKGTLEGKSAEGKFVGPDGNVGPDRNSAVAETNAARSRAPPEKVRQRPVTPSPPRAALRLRSRSRSNRRTGVRQLTERSVRLLGDLPAGSPRLEVGRKYSRCGLQRDLRRRPAICPNKLNVEQLLCDASKDWPEDTAASSADFERSNEPLAPSVGIANLQVATWVLGESCCPEEFLWALAVAPFTCTILILTASAVAAEAPICIFLKLMDEMQDLDPKHRDWHKCESMKSVLDDKYFFRLGRKQEHSVYAALHRAKVSKAQFTENEIRSRGEPGIQFGTLELKLDTSRQRMNNVQIGVLDVRREPNGNDASLLADWIIVDRVGLLTGHFGSYPGGIHTQFAQDLANQSKAVGFHAFCQHVTDDECTTAWFHPSFYMMYGCFHRIKIDGPTIAALPKEFDLGADIWKEMIRWEETPRWDKREQGSAFVGPFGTIKMKCPDWKRWFNHCYQTVLWIGTSTPSISSQNRSRGKGKDKGNAKGKGKGGKQLPNDVVPQGKKGKGQKRK